jgi:V/A-type H+-transporting ATPase subunit E
MVMPIGLGRVVTEILNSGKKDAEKIITEGRAEAARILREAREKRDNAIAERRKEVEDMINRMSSRELSIGELEAKKSVLNVKNRLMDAVYERVLTRLAKLDTTENNNFLQVLITRADHDFTDGVVYCNARDIEFVKTHTKLKFGGTIDCIGGIVVESADGSVKQDYRYETILREAWNNAIKEISETLFTEGT